MAVRTWACLLLRWAAEDRIKEMKTSEGDRSAPCRRREYSSASRFRGRRLHNDDNDVNNMTNKIIKY